MRPDTELKRARMSFSSSKPLVFILAASIAVRALCPNLIASIVRIDRASLKIFQST